MRRSLWVAAGIAAGVAFAASLLAVLSGPDDVVDGPTRHVESAGVAVVTNPNVISRVGPVLHVTARRTGTADADLLLALGHTEDVRSYLGEAPHEVVLQVLPEVAHVRHEAVAGTGRLPSRPLGQDFWVLRASGPDVVAARWPTTDGVWSWALLNADGSPGVAADVSVGVEVPGLFAASLGVLGADAAATLTVTLLLVRRRRGPAPARRRRPSPRRGRAPSALAAGPTPRSPVDVG